MQIKITLNDAYLCPIADGTVSYFVDSNECSATPDLFKDDVIESFVWHIVHREDDKKTLNPLNEKELQYLLRDIIGEGG